MTTRPLHAVLLPPAEAGGRMFDALAAALDGSGPAILPLDPDLPRARLNALLDALAPSAIETQEGLERPVSSRAGHANANGISPETALVIATSGSTGPPKGTELSAAALRASAAASLRRVGAASGERWLCCLPTFHIAGVQVLIRSLLSGTTPLVVPRLEPGALAASGCSHVSLVPTQLRRLLDAGDDLTAVKTILLGGAAAAPGLLRAARSAGGRVVTTYGMSETGGGCVYDGMPLDDVSVDIGPGGRIRIAGPVLFSGYRLRPDLTARARDGRWFITSDIGSISPSGELMVRGRADDVINTGGEKVVAAEVEAALGNCAGVRDVAVVGRPDREWGEVVTAVVVPVDPSQPPHLAGIREHVRHRLPVHAAPAGLVLMPKLPMLASGKPDREALKAHVAEFGGADPADG
ncbi:MAG TPA: AMP-binding protein [Streptosporangiaceae bacterium]|nr:AMP-binding protein [Streptosporangiaceae bacterium]